MTWREYCLDKAEECDLNATECVTSAAADEWRLSAAEWCAAGAANDNRGPGCGLSAQE